MSTKGNIGWQLKEMQPALAAATVVRTIFESTDGMIIGYSNITTGAALNVISNVFAPGCLVICVASDGVNSVQLMINEGSAATPDFTTAISVGSIDPDA